MEEDRSLLESVGQSSTHINQTADSSGSEVSSTTTDPDFVSLSGSTQRRNSLSQHVQSGTADSVKDNMAPVMKKSAPMFSSTKLGFQDAFAAFASASYHEAPDDSSGDESNELAAGSAPPPQATLSADTSSYSFIDSCVSSAIDSGQVTTTADSFITSANDNHYQQIISYADVDNQSTLGLDPNQVGEQAIQTSYESHLETSAVSESVYFIQTTDASGQVVTSIIDPHDIPSYTDSVVYKQCMRADGEIETCIVYSAGMAISQEEQPQEPVAAQPEQAVDCQPQIIYAHDINGHLTPIDSTQSFTDIAPPGKQFVYMQDSTGRIIRTIMDADQTMIPGQQVYYTQSDDGRIITSVMDPAIAGEADETMQGQQQQTSVDQVHMQQYGDAGIQQQQQYGDAGIQQQQPYGDAGIHQQESSLNGVTSNFNIDNNMSGLSMLAELSHFTSGQAFSAVSGLSTDLRTATSSTDSNSLDQDEFRPIATITRPAVSDEGMESVSSDIADLKVVEADPQSRRGQSSSPSGSGIGQEETLVTKVMSQLNEEALTSLAMPRDNLFVQWQNLDAMCWMDVVLVMLVNLPSLRPFSNLDPSHDLSSTLLITLLKANRQAQMLIQNLLKKSNSSEATNLQTGAGNMASTHDPKTSKLVCKENMDEIGKAINILYAMREKIWQTLQPRLRCERGKHNSPVLVLPLIIREKPVIKHMFTMEYRYVFKCTQCQYCQDDSQTKMLPSIPAVPDDFNMQSPSFIRNCFECSATDQRMYMKFEV